MNEYQPPPSLPSLALINRHYKGFDDVRFFVRPSSVCGRTAVFTYLFGFFRWDDDVVFKNCAKMEDDKKKTEFINDTLRSEFHRKFMSKYIK